ncbi:hypothetical protein MHU86_3537 [Fragilaria crotonensis]|nr:hypothetical protein MHU86_9282 [Fragilaria crotonensis]KAI2510916.1 hypothetical protein MHU86_3537 [Fragilaria crotonensis]
MITANYTLGGNCYMVATSNLRSFKAGHVAAIPNEDNELMTESGIQSQRTQQEQQMMVELFLRERACAKDLRSEWAFSAIEVGLCCKIKLVKGVDLVGDNNDETPNEDGLMHDIRILKQEGSHHGWFRTNRIVCANLYHTSVRAAKDLFRKGLRFIAG